MTAAIVDTAKLGKVIAYALGAGVGITGVYALGITGAAATADALRRRRSVAGALWAAVTALCGLACLAAIVLGIVVMSAKG
jgi:hypothetical protein